MAEVWANSMACHPRATYHIAECCHLVNSLSWFYSHNATCHIAGCCHRVNSMACHPRATYHIAGCCHLVNSLSWFQSYMPYCRVLLPGEFNDMSSHSYVSRCRVGLLPLGEFTVMVSKPHATSQGAATWWIQCHDTSVTCHIAGVRIPSAILKIVSRHILCFCFLNAVWALTSGGFRIVSDTLVLYRSEAGIVITACVSVCPCVCKI